MRPLTVAEAIKVLEDAGVLSWVQRVKRVRVRCPDLFGADGCAWCRSGRRTLPLQRPGRGMRRIEFRIRNSVRPRLLSPKSRLEHRTKPIFLLLTTPPAAKGTAAAQLAS